MKCDKCGEPFGDKTRGRQYGHHCPCCGALGRNGLRTTACDCGASWSEYALRLVQKLRGDRDHFKRALEKMVAPGAGKPCTCGACYVCIAVDALRRT